MAKKVVLKHFQKSVTTAGTRAQLTSTKILALSVMIQAKAANTNKIYVGDSTVSATEYAAVLSAENSVTFEAPPMSNDVQSLDLSTFYIDSAVNGEGVSVGYLATDS